MTESNVASQLLDTEITPEYEAICANENLAHIGQIQGCGFMMVGSLREGTLVQLSSNAPAMMGGSFAEVGPSQLLGKPLTHLLGAPWLKAVRDLRGSSAPIKIPLIDTADWRAADWRCRGHVANDLAVLEFMPAPPETADDISPLLRTAVATISDAEDVDDLAARTANAFQLLTGFDRVMVYRFLPDWSGEVMAESTAEGHPVLYEGSRFPASDIPAQARALYDASGIRLTMDTQQVNASMVPATPAGSDGLLDMSRCLLRAVSIAHLDYLKSMGVRQSVSIAIHHDERLWGLISCHKGLDGPLPTWRFGDVMRAADRVSVMVESVLAEHIEREERGFLGALPDGYQSTRETLHAMLSSARVNGYAETSLHQALEKLRRQHQFTCVGYHHESASALLTEQGVDTDSLAANSVSNLFDGYRTATGQHLLETRSLEQDFPGCPNIPKVIGMMVYRPVEYAGLTVFLGLGEHVETVTWAGSPTTVRTGIVNDKIAVRPRDSFEKWQVAERGKSRFWTSRDQKTLFEIANTLRIWMTQRNNAWRDDHASGASQ